MTETEGCTARFFLSNARSRVVSEKLAFRSEAPSGNANKQRDDLPPPLRSSSRFCLAVLSAFLFSFHAGDQADSKGSTR